jgi:hypothetical protein
LRHFVAGDDAGRRAMPEDEGPTSEEALVRLTPVSRRITALSAVLAALLGTSSCGLAHINELAFRVDHRLHFVAPKSRSLVHNPVTLRWTMRDFRIEGPGTAPPSRHAGYFAVFVDQSPVRPGQTLKAVSSGNPFCRQDPASCLTTAYLAQQEVFTTTQESLTVPNVTNIPGNHQGTQLHSFIVVLMDTSGHRIGESAWEIDLQMKRIGSA